MSKIYRYSCRSSGYRPSCVRLVVPRDPKLQHSLMQAECLRANQPCQKIDRLREGRTILSNSSANSRVEANKLAAGQDLSEVEVLRFESGTGAAAGVMLQVENALP
jgi:hypothetical protein